MKIEEVLKVYRMLRLIFGVNFSLFFVIVIVNVYVNKYVEIFFDVIREILYNMYVDDCLIGVDIDNFVLKF